MKVKSVVLELTNDELDYFAFGLNAAIEANDWPIEGVPIEPGLARLRALYVRLCGILGRDPEEPKR
jgi:hypothetical protein